MCSLMANLLLPAKLKPDFSDKERSSSIIVPTKRYKRTNQSIIPVIIINLFLWETFSFGTLFPALCFTIFFSFSKLRTFNSYALFLFSIFYSVLGSSPYVQQNERTCHFILLLFWQRKNLSFEMPYLDQMLKSSSFNLRIDLIYLIYFFLWNGEGCKIVWTGDFRSF